MYLNFYKFKKGPFGITPDPEFLFLSPSHKEALGAVIYGIRMRRGFVSVVGEVGTGKTTILRAVLARANPEVVKAVYIFNANVSFNELLRTIFDELEIDLPSAKTCEMVRHLHKVLIEEYKCHRSIVLIIDEAQNMPIDTLENLRMLSNIETSTEKLIQIVLVGQPELEQKLNQLTLRQLKQRIAVRAVITPLTLKESLGYIKHRLSKAQHSNVPVFTPGALKRIVKQAKGCPRTLNILCDNALIAGCGYRKKPVTSSIVRQVIRDFSGRRKCQRMIGRLAMATGLAALVVVLLGPIIFAPSGPKDAGPVDSFLAGEAVPLTSPTTEETSLDQQDTDSMYRNPTLTSVQTASSKTVLKTAPRLLLSMPKELNDEELYASRTVGEEVTDTVKEEPFALGTAAATPQTRQLDADSETGVIEISHEPEQDAPMLLGMEEGDSRPAATPSETPEHDGDVPEAGSAPPATVLVKKGDHLSRLAVGIYGQSNNRLLAWIKANNSDIHDIDYIQVGQEIFFPELNTTLGEAK